MKKQFLSIFLVCLIVLSCFTGCEVSSSSEITTSIIKATSATTSVDSSVLISLQARVGSNAGSTGHTASLGADISVKSTFEPFAYFGEYYSNITVDGVTTREDKEYYVLGNEDGGYTRYEYDDATEEWKKVTLTREEEFALPLKTCVIQDWGHFLSYLEYEEAAEIKGTAAHQFKGQIPAVFIQDLIGHRVFGSFLFSLEHILSDTIECVAYFNAETFLPIALELNFTNSFKVSDMLIDSGTITVEYKSWNTVPEIDLPKKVTIAATDETADFYASYYAWNLFLPYVNGANGSTGSSALLNTASWDSFKMRIDKNMLELPVRCRTLYDMGYTVAPEYSSYIVEANSVVRDVPIQRGGDEFYCSFYNLETYSQPIVDCSIGCIDFYSANIPNGSITLFLPGDIALGVTRDALVSAYGEPTSLEPGFSIDTYTWHGATDNQSLVCEVSPVNNRVIRIRLENMPVIVSTDAEQTDSTTETTAPTVADDNAG